MSVVSVSGPICRAYRAGLNKISSFTHIYQIPLPLPPAFHHSLIVQLGFFLLKKQFSLVFFFLLSFYLMIFICIVYF